MTITDTYTVAIYATPMSFPLNFTIHSWVEITHNGDTERYDLWAYKGLKSATQHNGHVYKNIFPDHLGTTWWPFADLDTYKHRQTGKIVSNIAGPAGSAAQELYEAIKNRALDYPAAHTYNMLFGPSCNTYTQWLITLVPEAELQLPWYAWGKGVQV